MAKEITIQLSESEYATLQEIATASSWSLKDVVQQCVRYGMPPTLNMVPIEFHDDLLSLNKMNDRTLLDIVEGNQQIADLDEFQRKADYPTLRRTYALSLLRWRGHPVPSPYESLM